MSIADLGRGPRMREYLKAEDLNTEGVVSLAEAILEDAVVELRTSARSAAAYPSKDNLEHLKRCREFFKSELFTALSMGLVDGETAARENIRDALRGRRVKLPKEASLP